MAVSKTREQKKEQARKRHIKCLHQLYQNVPDELSIEEIKTYGRCLATDIFDLSARHPIFTGHESKASIKRRKKKDYKPTQEHFYPRQFAGEFVIHHIQVYGDIRLPYFTRYIDIFRQVHYVTKEENQKLRYWQMPNRFTVPEYGYDQEGIELVKVLDNAAITHLDDVAPEKVLRHVYGNRYDEVNKYMLTR